MRHSQNRKLLCFVVTASAAHFSNHIYMHVHTRPEHLLCKQPSTLPPQQTRTGKDTTRRRRQQTEKPSDDHKGRKPTPQRGANTDDLLVGLPCFLSDDLLVGGSKSAHLFNHFHRQVHTRPALSPFFVSNRQRFGIKGQIGRDVLSWHSNDICSWGHLHYFLHDELLVGGSESAHLLN